MPRHTYTPTAQDKATGQTIRRLRKAAGETMEQTIRRAELGISVSNLANLEYGRRPIKASEAVTLAQHFGTHVDEIIAAPKAAPVETEQQWLGNPEPEPKPALFAVPNKPTGSASGDVVGHDPRMMLIDLDAPLSLADYREQVWIPYLESRYANELRQTG